MTEREHQHDDNLDRSRNDAIDAYLIWQETIGADDARDEWLAFLAATKRHVAALRRRRPEVRRHE